MTETLKSPYRPLFEVRLLHHYWLDDGATVFDSIADADRKNKLLLAYDRRAFLEVVPTPTTANALKGLCGVYKDTSLGFIIAVPSERTIPPESLFEFAVAVINPGFFAYTALTLPPQHIAELFHKPEQKLYRYKSNVFVFSNLTGTARGSGNGKTLFLSRPYPARSSDHKIEALVISGNRLSQLTSDPPNPSMRQIGTSAADLPIFAHQDDVPVIEPPEGLAGAPKRGVLLAGDLPDNLFALIRLAATGAGGNDFNLTVGGRPRSPHPVFQVRFKNRSTVRRYRNRRTGAEISTDAEALPMTQFGNAGNRQKPSSGSLKTETDGAKITRLISEIFV